MFTINTIDIRNNSIVLFSTYEPILTKYSANILELPVLH